MKKTPELSLIVCDVSDHPEPGLDSHSPFCLKVHRGLRWLGLPYTTRYGRQPGDFAHLNPARQVPVLLTDSGPVVDSTEILRWVSQASGRSLVPGLDAKRAAEAWLLEELADTALNGFVVASRWADDENWSRLCDTLFGKAPWPVRRILAPRVRARVLRSLHARDVTRHGLTRTWERLESMLDLLEARAPEAGYMLGDSPCVADVALFAQLRSLDCALTPRQRDLLRCRPRLVAYLARVDEATAPQQVVAPTTHAEAIRLATA